MSYNKMRVLRAHLKKCGVEVASEKRCKDLEEIHAVSKFSYTQWLIFYNDNNFNILLQECIIVFTSASVALSSFSTYFTACIIDRV